MPSRWSWRAALPVGLLGSGVVMALLAPRLPAPTVGETVVPRLADRLTCARVGSDIWSSLPGVDYTGVLVIDLPASARGAVVLIVADRIPLDLAARTEAGPFPMRRERLLPSTGIGIPPDLWLEVGGPWALPPEIARVTLTSFAERDTTVEVSLGRRAPRVLARLTGDAPDRPATICAGRPAVRSHTKGGVLEIGAAAREYFGTGWSAGESGPDRTVVRRMQHDGAILLPSEEDRGVQIQVRAAPLVGPLGGVLPLLSVQVNDVWDGAATPMLSGVADYHWRVPREAWAVGMNEILFGVSAAQAAGSPVGLALHTVRIISP